MTAASAAPYRANPAVRGQVPYRMAAGQARVFRAPAQVAIRLPYRRTLNAAPLARVAYNRVVRPAYGRFARVARPATARVAYGYRAGQMARPAYGRFARIARPATARVATGYRAGQIARPTYGRFAYRGYGRIALRFPARAMRYRALAPSTLMPRAAVAPVAVGGGQVGGASYYSGGGRTASGGLVGAATCAHRSLPFGTRVMVTNLSNARATVCTVNDRGPFIGGRVVDLSRGAAGAIGMLGSGVAPVRLTIVGRS